jgi:purine-cytosine permease-like protein
LFGGLKTENEANFSVVMGGKRLSVTGNAYEEIQKILGYVISVYIMIRFTDHYMNGKSNESFLYDLNKPRN